MIQDMSPATMLEEIITHLKQQTGITTSRINPPIRMTLGTGCLGQQTFSASLDEFLKFSVGRQTFALCLRKVIASGPQYVPCPYDSLLVVIPVKPKRIRLQIQNSLPNALVCCTLTPASLGFFIKAGETLSNEAKRLDTLLRYPPTVRKKDMKLSETSPAMEEGYSPDAHHAALLRQCLADTFLSLFER